MLGLGLDWKIQRRNICGRDVVAFLRLVSSGVHSNVSQESENAYGESGLFQLKSSPIVAHRTDQQRCGNTEHVDYNR